MVSCLICANKLSETISMTEILAWRPLKKTLMCDQCARAFSYISGLTCQQCGRQVNNGGYCGDCLTWQQQHQWYFSNTALVAYDEHFRQWLILLKGKGDLRLADYFKTQLSQLRKKYPNAVWVPIPSSPENKHKRGFNQTTYILEVCHMPHTELLMMNSWSRHAKQALKTKRDRINRTNPFILINRSSKIPQQIILFDDVYTTGVTMFQASQILIQAGAVEVRGVTLSK